MADLGDHAGLCRQIGQRLGLVDRHAHRLFDKQVLLLLKTPDPDVVHDSRLADNVDAVGRDLFDHLAIVVVMVRLVQVFRRNAELLARRCFATRRGEKGGLVTLRYENGPPSLGETARSG